MRKIILFGALLIVFASCTKEPDPTPKCIIDAEEPMDSEFVLNHGAAVYQMDHKLSVEFTSVVSDSRCPANVVCFWQGEATVKLTVTQCDNTELVTLSTVNNITGKAFGYDIKLQSVDPYPITTDPIDEKDYIINISVTGG